VKTGLDKPQFTVTLTTAGKDVKLVIGDRMAVGNTAYARVEGKGAIEVIPADVLDKLDRPAKTYREAKVVHLAALDVRQLSIQKNQQALKLEKDGADWKIVEPIKAPADASAVSDLVNTLAALKAKSFADDPAEASELIGTTPQMVVTLSTVPPATQPTTQPATAAAANTATLTFGHYDDVLKENVWVKVSGEPPEVVKLASSSMESLSKKPIDLRDKRVVDVKSRRSAGCRSRPSRRPRQRRRPLQPLPPRSQPAPKLSSERRKSAVEGGGVPFVPNSAATQPSTKPSAKLTLDDKMPRKSGWVLASAANAEADDHRRQRLAHRPAPASRRQVSGNQPATQPAKSYTVSVHTEAAGGAGAADFKLRLRRPRRRAAVRRRIQRAHLEVSRFTLSKYLEGDYKKKPGGSNIGGPSPQVAVGARVWDSMKSGPNSFPPTRAQVCVDRPAARRAAHDPRGVRQPVPAARLRSRVRLPGIHQRVPGHRPAGFCKRSRSAMCRIVCAWR